jgi:phospholipase C
VDSPEARERLFQIDHIIVVMMENRSFDHMLGYLSLPHEVGGAGRADIDGLTSPEHNVNRFDGETYGIQPMEGEDGLTKVQDPGHSGADVGQQMAHGMSGFVANYMTTRAYQEGGDVMRYQVADNVPVYDFFSQQFAICDRWFCSVPGSTWPNRVSALTGEARSTDNSFPPIYSRRSFVRSLPASVSWRWYSSDPGSLRLVDGTYRTGHQNNFAYVEKPSLVQPRTFYTDAMKEELPSVAWIDPNFVDLGGLQGANDDHPPTDVMAGQSFVMKIYQTLKDSALWEKSMLVIVYDEHGGFYDHVDPTAGLPAEFAARAEFRHFGPRVPAIVVSPLVQAGAAFGSAQDDDPRFLFDHTALIKTILLRFAGGDCGGLPARVASSSHLGHLLTGGPPRSAPEIPPASVEKVADWWSTHIAFRLMHPSATIPALQELGVVDGPVGPQAAAQDLWALLGRAVDWIRARFKRRPEPEARPAAAVATAPVVLAEASELQIGVAAAARQIRREGLPPGQP